MVGGSYGGGIDLLTAEFDARIRAIVASRTWHSLQRPHPAGAGQGRLRRDAAEPPLPGLRPRPLPAVPRRHRHRRLGEGLLRNSRRRLGDAVLEGLSFVREHVELDVLAPSWHLGARLWLGAAGTRDGQDRIVARLGVRFIPGLDTLPLPGYADEVRLVYVTPDEGGPDFATPAAARAASLGLHPLR